MHVLSEGWCGWAVPAPWSPSSPASPSSSSNAGRGPLSPEEVRLRCADLGLGIDLYQPFRDFEAV
ncbi:hypothetical protein ABZ837_39485, partial [Streptomyces sp. NPDC047197]|uniref:hypothetical protein n=1 Tax=Streptomyces sp. NPDC047197 TaxID=3155477 RepID=UPI0033ED6FFB